jgi:hypothetical protein
MFALPAATASSRDQSAPHLWLGEAVANAGLVLLVFALARSGARRARVAIVLAADTISPRSVRTRRTGAMSFPAIRSRNVSWP